MSYIVKLGAMEIAKDMCKSLGKDELEKSKVWCSGFFAGLNEAKAITGEELDELVNGLSEVEK